MIQQPPTIDVIHAYFVVHVEVELPDFRIPICVEQKTGNRVLAVETADEKVGQDTLAAQHIKEVVAESVLANVNVQKHTVIKHFNGLGDIWGQEEDITFAHGNICIPHLMIAALSGEHVEDSLSGRRTCNTPLSQTASIKINIDTKKIRVR